MPARLPVLGDRLGDREDVRLGEAAVERRAPVAARAEAHALRRILGIGAALVVQMLEPRDIYQELGRSGTPGEGWAVIAASWPRVAEGACISVLGGIARAETCRAIVTGTTGPDGRTAQLADP